MSFTDPPLTEKKRKHIWVQQVAVDADMLETRVKVARARGLDLAQEAAADGACEHIRKARNAALRDDPRPRWLTNWWRGTLVVAAYRNLHGARIQIVDIIDEPELQAEIPFAIARAQATLPRDDARHTTIEELQAEPVARLRARLRRLMDDSYEVLDDRYAQLRSFRNILLLTAGVVAFLVLLTIGVVSWHPNWVPVCFPHEVVTGADGRVTMTQNQWTCPTGHLTAGPAWGDIVIVSMLGALGGALAAAISIRHLRGTSTPYDVPVALAALKVPLGAFTAILALVAIQGGSFRDCRSSTLKGKSWLMPSSSGSLSRRSPGCWTSGLRPCWRTCRAGRAPSRRSSSCGLPPGRRSGRHRLQGARRPTVPMHRPSRSTPSRHRTKTAPWATGSPSNPPASSK